jgi:hypothetical protein
MKAQIAAGNRLQGVTNVMPGAETGAGSVIGREYNLRIGT